MSEHHQTHNHQLVGADADAVDALVEAGFNVSAVPAPMRARALHAAAVFGLMDHAPAAPSQTLVDVTMARLARMASPMGEVEAMLSPDDAEALDAFVASEFRVGKVPSALRPRAERLEAMVRLLADTSDARANPLLVERTMRAVTTAQRTRTDVPSSRGVGGFRFADLVSVAAVLLMGVAVLWPVASTMRGYSQKAGCGTNLAGIASALGAYTSDFKDQLPMASASFGGSWLNVGSTPDRSNSANLYTLAKAGYTGLDALACDGNPHAQHGEAVPGASDWESLRKVSYSYYIMFGDARPSPLTSPQTVILADKSPVVMRAANDEPIPFPEENSPNHAGEGQWALRADGSAVWLSTPYAGADNLWLNGVQQQVWEAIRPHLPELQRQAKKLNPNAKQMVITIQGVPGGRLMQGNELPESETETFLGP